MARSTLPLSDPDGFRARLRSARKSAGLTQVNAADLLGITQASITDYERGRTQPSPGALYHLAKLYAVSVDWLLSGLSSEEHAEAASMREPPEGFDLIRLPDNNPLSQEERAKVEAFIAGMRAVKDDVGENEGLAGQKTA